jgi:hypothetical protein
MNAYAALVANPLATLQQRTLMVNGLPPVADATVSSLYFASANNDLAIDQTELMAWNLIMGNQDGVIQRRMLVSCMRGSGLAVGAGVGARHQATRTVQAGAAGADLWVTEVQTGCTVLILDWGGDNYSMIHLQPSADNQFNRLGQGLMDVGYYTQRITGEHLFRNAYKNTWLKKEITTIVSNTGAVPRYYIMIQSMFEASRGGSTQVLGVRQHGRFQFFRQRQNGANLLVEHLQWCGWYAMVPYRSY